MSEETREDLVYDIRKLTLTQSQSREYFKLKEYKTKSQKEAEKAAAAAAKAAEAPAAIDPAKEEACKVTLQKMLAKVKAGV